ncbi:tubulin polyglutamylase TTLL2, partial [Paragonimus westermani]
MLTSVEQFFTMPPIMCRKKVSDDDPISKSSMEDTTRKSPHLYFTEKPPIFKITYGHGSGPPLLRKALLEAGIVEFDPQCHNENQWNLWWKGFRFKEEEFKHLSSIQRVNHHPAPVGRHADIIKKDGLLRAVRRMCATYPKCTNLLPLPTTFHLPREEHRFVSTFCQNTRNLRNKVSKPYGCKIYENPEYLAGGCGNYTNRTIGETIPGTNIWILKPADLSGGRGIYLFNQLEDLVYLSKSVVQKYITDPLLIEGYKFDLRLYAVVPSYAPFIVYVCADGLVRFATDRYDLDNLKNVYSHLTNSSINVNGPGYLVNKAGIGRGCKWTIRQLRQWLATHKLDDRLLWTRVKVLIILTLLCQAGSTPK